MRKALIIISIIFIIAAVADELFLAGGARVINRVTLPFKIARLHFEEPDQRLAMPVKTIQVKQVKDTWQAPRPGNRLHEGQDIFAPQGTAVCSATAGYVVRIGANELGGKTVSVIGAGGRRYYYAHLDDYAPTLAVGDYATPDTVLGYVGTTGNARGTPPHLHFGVYESSGAINPLPLLKATAAAR